MNYQFISLKLEFCILLNYKKGSVQRNDLNEYSHFNSQEYSHFNSQEDYGYGGPWPDYDMSYGPPHKTQREPKREEDDHLMASMGLPSSFTATIDQPMENFAEDIPLEAKGRINQGGKLFFTVKTVATIKLF